MTVESPRGALCLHVFDKGPLDDCCPIRAPDPLASRTAPQILRLSTEVIFQEVNADLQKLASAVKRQTGERLRRLFRDGIIPTFDQHHQGRDAPVARPPSFLERLDAAGSMISDKQMH